MRGENGNKKDTIFLGIEGMHILIAMIVAGITFMQLSLFKKQNVLTEKQTHQIDVQSQLSEASRRSGMYLLLGDLYQEINEEIRNQNLSSNQSPELSEPLLNQIGVGH